MDLFDFDFSSDNKDSYGLIFFDTETTGSAKDDEIIEIGAIVEKGQNITTYDELCGTSKLIAVEAMVTHGIRNEDIKDKEPFNKSKFYSNLDGLNKEQNYFIAHNLPFDLERLKFYGFNPKAKLIDTLQCAKHLFELEEPLGYLEYPLPNYKLQTFRYILFTPKQEQEEANRFNISIKAHSALSDVIILRMFFYKLLERLMQKYPKLNKQEALDELVVLSKKPVLVKKFNFGKHKGKLIKDVLIEDRGYLEWLYNDMKKQLNSGGEVDENMFATLKVLLEQV